MDNESLWIIVDLVNDFVTGKFGSENALKVANQTAEVLTQVTDSIDVVFTMDTHIKNDPEFKVWSEHCLIGTEACELHSSISGYKGYRIRKRHFDAFYDTDLDGYIRARQYRNLYISGVSTDICVLHTASGSFFRGFIPVIISNLCASIDITRHEDAILFMQRNYGAKIIDSENFVREIV